MSNPGYHGRWLPADQDPREANGSPRGERDCLVSYLEHYRTTLALKCDGLTPEQLATKAVPPSNISLLGLVRHMARVEHSWARRVFEGQAGLVRLFAEPEEDAGFNFPEVGSRLVDEANQAWQAEMAHARTVFGGLELDALVVDVHGDQVEVRDVIVHLIEEYARHCGHADLVREVVDGRVGS